MAILTRRNLLVGLGSALAAPAIVRASNIMPVRAIDFGAQPAINVFSYFDRGGRWLADVAGDMILNSVDIPGPAVFFRYQPLYGSALLPIVPSRRSQDEISAPRSSASGPSPS